MDVPAPVLDFSLVRGGLVARLLRHAPGPRRRRVDARAWLLPLLAWGPLLVLCALEGGGALAAFVGDTRVHAQLLLTVPGLVAAEPFVDARLALAARLLVSSGLVPEAAVPRYTRAVERLSRLRASPWVELALLAVAALLGGLEPLRHRPAWLTDTGGGLAPAGLWYAGFGLTLLRFLLVRWAWRALVWAALLWRTARLGLELRATHPDRAGGLAFLGRCQASFAAVVLAAACAVAGAMRDRVEYVLAEDLWGYAAPLLVLAVVAVLVLFAPLAFFTPALVRARWRGTERFSALAAWHSREFERQWFGWRALAQRRSAGESILGSPDPSSLIDLGSSFDVQRRMRYLPLDRFALLQVAGAALLPLVPLLLAHRQFLAVLRQLAQVFL